MNNLFNIFMALGIIINLYSCKEQKSSRVNVPYDNPTPTPDSTTPYHYTPTPGETPTPIIMPTKTGVTFNLCQELKTNSTLQEYDFSDFISDLCDKGLISALQRSDIIYNGSGDPKYDLITDEKANNETYMRFNSSLITSAWPMTYYKMLKLQLTNPDTFIKYFDYDHNATYKLLSNNGNMINYSYYNDKDKDELKQYVSYEGQAKFIEIKAGLAYVMVTKSTKNISSIKALKGLTLITWNSPLRQTEVFSISEQTYDNAGRHAATVSKSIASFKADIIRSYENAIKAKSYFLQK